MFTIILHSAYLFYAMENKRILENDQMEKDMS